MGPGFRRDDNFGFDLFSSAAQRPSDLVKREGHKGHAKVREGIAAAEAPSRPLRIHRVLCVEALSFFARLRRVPSRGLAASL
jgi:hypothetical protein